MLWCLSGQKRDVLVLRLVCAGTVEEDILDKAAAKRDLDAKVIQVGCVGWWW